MTGRTSPSHVTKILLTPEMEESMKRIQNSRNVAGILLINREGIPIKTSMDSSVTAQYSGLISHLCSRAKATIRAMDPTNELNYLRVGSKKQEILIAPDEDFILIVIQNQVDSISS